MPESTVPAGDFHRVAADHPGQVPVDGAAPRRGRTAGKPREVLVLSEDERRVLERWASRRKTAQGLAQRARIVLTCADGMTAKELRARPVRRVVRSAPAGRAALDP